MIGDFDSGEGLADEPLIGTFAGLTCGDDLTDGLSISACAGGVEDGARRPLALSPLLVREWYDTGLMPLWPCPACDTGREVGGDGAPALPVTTLPPSKLFTLRLRYLLAASDDAADFVVMVMSSLAVRVNDPGIGGGGV